LVRHADERAWLQFFLHSSALGGSAPRQGGANLGILRELIQEIQNGLDKVEKRSGR
jgi:hypothetical protein